MVLLLARPMQRRLMHKLRKAISGKAWKSKIDKAEAKSVTKKAKPKAKTKAKTGPAYKPEAKHVAARKARIAAARAADVRAIAAKRKKK